MGLILKVLLDAITFLSKFIYAMSRVICGP